MDVMSNDLLAALLRQTLLQTVPFSPVLHDLSLSPRNMKAEQIPEFGLDMDERKDLMERYDHIEVINMPRISGGSTRQSPSPLL